MYTTPFHLVVGEPELKWCEAILCGIMPSFPDDFDQLVSVAEMQKRLLMLNTNMSEIRINRALNLLRLQKRI